MKPKLDKYGYMKVKLIVAPNDQRDFQIHRLVAILFISNPDNLPTVNHIDGNKTNNMKNNLEWNTYQANKLHAFDTGITIKPIISNRRFIPQYSDDIVHQICELLMKNKPDNKISEIVGCQSKYVQDIRRRRIRKDISDLYEW
jgi:hypothetical protein